MYTEIKWTRMPDAKFYRRSQPIQNAPSGNRADNRPRIGLRGHWLYLATREKLKHQALPGCIFCFALCGFTAAHFSTRWTLDKSTVIWRCAGKDWDSPQRTHASLSDKHRDHLGANQGRLTLTWGISSWAHPDLNRTTCWKQGTTVDKPLLFIQPPVRCCVCVCVLVLLLLHVSERCVWKWISRNMQRGEVILASGEIFHKCDLAATHLLSWSGLQCES